MSLQRKTLRKNSRNDSIIIVGDEPHPAYSRMAIPYMLAGDVDESGTYLRHNPNHFDDLEIEIRQDSVTSINSGEQTVALASGGNLGYDRLLLATGSSAIRPPISGMDSSRVHNCWTLDDTHRILNDMNAGDRVVLLGAGFIWLYCPAGSGFHEA